MKLFDSMNRIKIEKRVKNGRGNDLKPSEFLLFIPVHGWEIGRNQPKVGRKAHSYIQNYIFFRLQKLHFLVVTFLL